MAITNLNLKQITNWDIVSRETETLQISLPNRIKNEDGTYKIVNTPFSVQYQIALEDVEIVKMGYCCEPLGIDYPIFLQINGKDYKEFYVGKDGMFEMQPETWKSLNSDDSTEPKETNVTITGVKVPYGISFVLEYVVSVN